LFLDFLILFIKKKAQQKNCYQRVHSNSKPGNVTTVQEVRISHQGSNAEATVVLKLNQGE